MIINKKTVMKSWLSICYILLFIDDVSLQKTVEGFVGSSAVLSCHYNKKLQDLTAHWRYNDIKNVYDIQEGRGSAREQHQEYTGRVQAFSHEFVKGNFSLKIENLRLTDAGTYCCYIIDTNYQECTDLSVKVKPRETRTKSEEKSERMNHGVDIKADEIVALLIPLLSMIIPLCI
ncbi:V-set domain-containing T-cell activation inhibitor 1 [Triplophysa dalaica]|uniref:V-set domain-containing T-cell activation inhibitor 1 n=1 Tax=Triplophysa dalaica TaxID=1582913 RepID=UPI0024DF7029|nr:V-set domain-containing T-cell activation inhibitor 1 [Triplophysa dalaica]